MKSFTASFSIDALKLHIYCIGASHLLSFKISPLCRQQTILKFIEQILVGCCVTNFSLQHGQTYMNMLYEHIKVPKNTWLRRMQFAWFYLSSKQH